MQEVFIYLDDSGVLHNNSNNRYFIYAGYFFLSKKEKDRALATYRAAVNRVNKHPETELKAYGAKGKTKRYLVSTLGNYESFGCIVDTRRVYPTIMHNKKSIHRYKDYCIKRAAKNKIIELINKKALDQTKPVTFRFFIDNQHTSTDGLYNLKESIHEELSVGITNFDYGIYHYPLFQSEVLVQTSFCDSRNHYLIQASDMLANCLFTKYNYRPSLHYTYLNHTEIILP